MSRRAFAVMSVAGFSLAALALGDGAYDSTLHGDLQRGVLRVPNVERGDCGHCHGAHASEDGAPVTPHPMLLFAENDDALCFTCHAAEGAARVYLGQLEATANAHATSPSCRWPGPTPPARPGADAGKCLNCHNPHGAKDGDGVIPSMAVAREEAACLACHGPSGPAQDDIASELNRQHRHPIAQFSGRHAADEGADPAAYSTSRRHAECSDCHNVHAAQEDGMLSTPPRAGPALRGVASVEVTNGGPGASPIYTWQDGSQNLEPPPREYEVCFRCHSGWSQFTGEDLGIQLNPNNPSYHPVEAQGRDPNIPSGAFVNGVNASSVVLCSDCHRSSDPGAPKGPHGSDERAILGGWYPASTNQQTIPTDALCFQCHAYEVYADHDAAPAVKALSRWNEPAFEEGHSKHVGDHGFPCSACHAEHGSATHPSLIVTGRGPGIQTYSQTATGGVCGPSCHAQESYGAINYPR